MKKFVLLLSLSLMLSNILPVHAAEGDFSDVNTDNPHYKAVMYLKSVGATQGYPDGTFKPNNHITRAELLKIAMVSAGVTKTLPDGYIENFDDVPADAWYAPYTATARYKNVLGGVDGKVFPGNNVTLIEALKIVILINGYNIDKYQHPTGDEWKYNSNFKNNEWYTGYVRWAELSGLVSPQSLASITPDYVITRGEAADIIYGVALKKTGTVQADLNNLENQIMALMQAVQEKDLAKAQTLVVTARGVYEAAFKKLPDNKVVQGAGKIVEAFEMLVSGFDGKNLDPAKKQAAIEILGQVKTIEPSLEQLATNMIGFFERL